MKNNPKCNCGETAYKTIYKASWVNGKFPYEIRKCNSCGLTRTFPVPRKTTSNIKELEWRFNNVELWRFFGKNLIETIERYKKGKNLQVLDIGCNFGGFVKTAQEHHWQAVGIDIDRRAIALGKERLNIDIRETNLEKANFKPHKFDVVVLSHVLEHIKQPLALLSIIKRILDRKGIAVIIVPNIEGLTVKLQNIRGKQWYGYDPKHHVWHFTPKTLRKLVEDSGFNILDLDISKSLYYGKDDSLKGFARDYLLKLVGLLKLANQIILIATPRKSE